MPEERASRLTLPDEGEYPGVDVNEIEARAAALIADFSASKTDARPERWRGCIARQSRGDGRLSPASGVAAGSPRHRCAGCGPGATRRTGWPTALDALKRLTDARLDDVERTDRASRWPGRAVPRTARSARDRTDEASCSARTSRSCRSSASDPTRREFNASLAEQDKLTLGDPWQVTGWIPKLARVREGLDRFAAALSAHEALVDVSARSRFQPRPVSASCRTDMGGAAGSVARR